MWTPLFVNELRYDYGSTPVSGLAPVVELMDDLATETIKTASGTYKWDAEGNKIIDFKTGHGAMILGHSHPNVVKAVQDAVAEGTQMGCSTDKEIKWGQLVKELVPCAEKVRFQSSGTEAVMMAMRLARAYTGKTKVIKFDDQ